MRRECREHFPLYRLERKPLVSDPGMHHGTCVTHVPWCMSGSLNRGGGENVPGIPGECATHNFTYLVRGPYRMKWHTASLRKSRKIRTWTFHMKDSISFLMIRNQSRRYIDLIAAWFVVEYQISEVVRLMSCGEMHLYDTYPMDCLTCWRDGNSICATHLSCVCFISIGLQGSSYGR